jgi:hypothetical protein
MPLHLNEIQDQRFSDGFFASRIDRPQLSREAVVSKHAGRKPACRTGRMPMFRSVLPAKCVLPSNDSALALFDELDDFGDLFGLGQLFLHRFDCLAGVVF